MDDKLTLYSFWRSQASYRVRIALSLKGHSAELRTIDLLKGEQHLEDYRAVNPEGLVPAFIEGSQPPLVQSLAIIEYIDEKHPEPPLLPRGLRDRAHVRGLAQVAAMDAHPLIVPRVRNHLAATFNLDDEGRMTWVRHWFAAGLDAYEGHLSRDKATGLYCHGDTVTMADLCLVSHAAGTRVFKGTIDNHPTVKRIVERCLADERFASAQPLRQPGAPAAH